MNDRMRIDVSRKYPAYWEYGGKPALLLGGSVEDNLFQIPRLEEHLAIMKSAGGNYVRCTMSSRDPGDAWPYEKAGDRYDLDRPSPEYWRRFSLLLSLADEMDIIVQIEVWDRFDFYREVWKDNPYHPHNNLQYGEAESGLLPEYDVHPGTNANRFFYSVPGEDDNPVLLKYQRQFVDTLLAYSLRHPNVLYCMDNETKGSPRWGEYWATYIRRRAREQGISVHTTEMWDAHDLEHERHRATFDHPELYSFCDVSQNNHQSGQAHWDKLQRAREIVSRPVRPLNNVKIYGAETSNFGSEQDAVERFWRNILGKAAAARFHRPPSGIGLSERAQAQLRSARLLTGAMDFFECDPHNEWLLDRGDNEAYCMGNPGKEAAVFFPRAGEAALDTSAFSGSLEVSWLHIDESRWLDPQIVAAGDRLRLATPLPGAQAVLVRSSGGSASRARLG